MIIRLELLSSYVTIVIFILIPFISPFILQKTPLSPILVTTFSDSLLVFSRKFFHLVGNWYDMTNIFNFAFKQEEQLEHVLVSI